MSLGAWVGVLFAPFTASRDPVVGLWRRPADTRHLECRRTTVERALQEHPGQLAPRRERGDFVERDVMVCLEDQLPQVERGGREAATLRDLSVNAAGMAAQAEAAALGEVTWLVLVHDPSAQLAHKVAFATKTALVERGLRVTDRVPSLAAGDVDVLARLEPLRAVPLACRRFQENGTLQAGEALLLAARLDSRDTRLHAGLCVDGQWSWLP